MVRAAVSVGLFLFASLVVRSNANSFLQANASKGTISKEDVKQLWFSELAGSLGREKLDRIENQIRPMYAALPKDGRGHLERAAVRYALHRYFVQRHGWYVEGLKPSDGAWNASTPDAVTKDRVPAYIQELFEERLGRQGFGIKELVVFAATLEDLVRAEAVGKLEKAFSRMKIPTHQRSPAERVIKAIDLYMMAFIVGAQVLGAGLPFNKIEKIAADIYPNWPETKLWVSDVRMSTAHADRHRHNFFAGEGMDLTDATRIVEAIGEGFGPFQDLECRQLKSDLLAKEIPGTGRVSLARFYAKVEDTKFEFSESVDYLRQLGALDESDPQRVTVVIANYVNSLSNCMAPSSFYSVCCRNECDGLLAHLETNIATPEAEPGHIAQLVANLPSDTVDAPRNLSAPLLRRLNEIAEHHGGRVPLHGRLFSQWMHHAYPRECPYPHVSGTTKPLTVFDWMKLNSNADPAVTDAEVTELLKEHTDDGFVLESLPWTAVEELVVAKAADSVFPVRTLLRTASLLAAVAVVAGHLWRASRAGLCSGALPKDERHFV